MRFINDLTKVLCKDLKRSKMLVMPSLREGKQILKQCAKKGQALFNVKNTTLTKLAEEICAPLLAKKDSPRFLKPSAAEDLVYQCLCDIGKSGFFANEHIQERKTAAIFQQIISELNGHKVSQVSGNERLEAIEKVRQEYQKLKEDRYLDRNDLLQLAIDEIRKQNTFADTQFIILDSLSFTSLEKELLKAIAGDNIITINIDEENINVSEKMSFYACRGSDTEQDFIMRDIIENGRAVEECTIVCLDSSYYNGLYNSAKHFNLPVTSDSGLPLTSSRIYDVLQLLANWEIRDFYAEELYLILASGVISLPNIALLADLLRAKDIGWGKERYYSILLKEDERVSDETLDAWREFFDLIFAIASKAGNMLEQKKNIKQFLERYIDVDDKKEEAQLQEITYNEELLESGESAKTLDDHLMAMYDPVNERAALSVTLDFLKDIRWLASNEMVITRLLELLGETRYLEKGARSGALHITSLEKALSLGRKFIYIPNLSRFALSGELNFPLMLDEERCIYDLLTSEKKEERTNKNLRILLAQHEGEFIFSYCDYDIEKMIPLFPAPFYTKLAMDKVERIPYVKKDKLILSDYLSEQAKINLPVEKLKIDDMDESYKDILKNMRYSASSLEMAVECPLKFYLQHIMKLKTVEKREYDIDSWLAANEIGLICHKVLEKYYKGKNENLEELFEQTLADVNFDKPKVRASVEEDAKKALYKMVEDAVKWDEDNGRKVIATEKYFGGDFYLDIGGRQLKMTGSIDRVDKLPNGEIAILDYKTGAAKYYKDKKEYKLQPYLYTLAAEKLYQDSRIKEAGYLFLKGMAEYFSLEQSEDYRLEREQFLKALFDWLENEEQALVPLPLFAVDDSGNMMVEDMGKRKDVRSKNNCRFCSFADFCVLEMSKKPDKEAK